MESSEDECLVCSMQVKSDSNGCCSISIAAAGLQKCEGSALRKIFRYTKEEKQKVAENCAGTSFVICTLLVMTNCGKYEAGWEFIRKGYKIFVGNLKEEAAWKE